MKKNADEMRNVPRPGLHNSVAASTRGIKCAVSCRIYD